MLSWTISFAVSLGAHEAANISVQGLAALGEELDEKSRCGTLMSSALPYDLSHLPYPAEAPRGKYRNSDGGFFVLSAWSYASRSPDPRSDNEPRRI